MAAGPDLRTLCQRHFAWSRDMDLIENVGVDQGHSAGKERRGSSASSLEIIGPERLSARRSVTVAAKSIQTLESSPVVGGRLAEGSWLETFATACAAAHIPPACLVMV